MNIVGEMFGFHLDTISAGERFSIPIYAEFTVGEDVIRYYTHIIPRRPLFGQEEIKYHDTAQIAQTYVNMVVNQ